MTRPMWIAAGLTSLGLGIVGAALPLLPTVPFLLLAAFCFSRSSTQLHTWLMEHPKFGKPLKEWEKSGSVSRRTKWIASLSMLVSIGLALWLQLPVIILGIQALCLTTVAIFLWTRPET